MRRGEFEAAWQISDRVRGLWDGTPLAGRRVVIRCNRGLGDTLQFARYAAMLDRAVIKPQRSLIPLIRTMGVPIGERGDVEIEVTELPHAMRTTLDTIPRTVPYIHVDPIALPQDERLRVGIVWRSGWWDRRRDIPRAQLVRALRGAKLYSLRREDAGTPLQTARLMRALDLVVTVDTMAAHLAGALGVNVWTLLHSDPDWRWLEHRDDSPWYPTMRLFRQRRAGDWSEVLERVQAALTTSRGAAHGVRARTTPESAAVSCS
jgi:hypothetical protein